MKYKRISSRLIVAATAACLLIPGVALAHADADAPAGDAAAFTQGALNWGIRASFNNYTSGATFIQEGAVRTDVDFKFPLQSYEYNAEDEHTEAQFAGLIRYRKYCHGESEKNLQASCDLDLTFKNPKVVLDPKGSYLVASVSSKQYPMGGVFAPENPVKIATLATSAATFEKADGQIKWHKIPTQLTDEGVKMFSNFYPVGDGLDPLSFTAVGEGERLSTDDTKLATKSKVWSSPAPSTYDQRHDLYNQGENILIVAGGKGAYLVSPSLTEVAHADFLASRHAFGDFDRTEGYYYFTESADKYENRLSNKVMRIKVNEDSFGEPEELGTVPGLIYGIGVHKKTGAKIVISIENLHSTTQPEKDYLTKIVDGKLQEPILLPSGEQLWGAPITSGSFYAPDFMSEPDSTNLLSMDDGTFTYLSNGQPYIDGASTSYRVFGLSIDPTKTEPAELVKLMNKSDDSVNYFMPAAATNGTYILRWNENTIHPYNQIEYLKYENRDMVSVTGVKHPEDLLGIAGAAWDKDGQLVLLDGAKGRLVWINPETMEPITENGKVKEFFIQNGRETSNKVQGNFLALSNGSYYVESLNEQTGDYIEHYELNGLYDPTLKDTSAPVLTIDGTAVEMNVESDLPDDEDLLIGVKAVDTNASGEKYRLNARVKSILYVPSGASEDAEGTEVEVVDPDNPGVYTVTYVAEDLAGNASASLTRVYTVKSSDTIAPVITIADGKEKISFTQDDRVLTAEDLLADVSATDMTEEDGESTSVQVVVKGITYADDSDVSSVVESVDLSKVGTYTVTFAATDESGNSAAEVSRTFVVTTKPEAEPTVEPSAEPSAEPTVEATTEATVEPSAEPTVEPSQVIVLKRFDAPKASAEVAKDVPANMAFSGEILWMMENNFSTGWPDGTYRPLNSVNRDAMAAFLYRMAGSPKVEASGSGFKDTGKNLFKNEIAWMKQAKISTGWDDGTYRPLEPVSREAMAAFLHRFCTLLPEKCAADLNPHTLDTSKALEFKDVNDNNPFVKDIAWLSAAKITTGWTEDGTFRPYQPIHRDAMAAFLYRLHHNKFVNATK